MLMSLEEILVSIEQDIAEILKKEFIFTISLLGTTIQDGGIKKEAIVYHTLCLRKSQVHCLQL